MPSSASDLYWQGRKVGESQYDAWRKAASGTTLSNMGINEEELKTRYAGDPLGMAESINNAWMQASNGAGMLSSKLREYFGGLASQSAMIGMLGNATGATGIPKTTQDWWNNYTGIVTGNGGTWKSGTAGATTTTPRTESTVVGYDPIYSFANKPTTDQYGTYGGETLAQFASRKGLALDNLIKMNPTLGKYLAGGALPSNIEIVVGYDYSAPRYGTKTTQVESTGAGTPGKWTGGSAKALSNVGTPDSWTTILQDVISGASTGKNSLLNQLSPSEGKSLLGMLLQRTNSPFSYSLVAKALSQYLAGQDALPNSSWYTGIDPKTGRPKGM